MKFRLFVQKKSGKNNNSKPILERGSVVQGCVSCKFTDQSLITAWRDHGKRAFCSLYFNSTSARLTGRQGREDHDCQRISIRIIRLAGCKLSSPHKYQVHCLSDLRTIRRSSQQVLRVPDGLWNRDKLVSRYSELGTRFSVPLSCALPDIDKCCCGSYVSRYDDD